MASDTNNNNNNNKPLSSRTQQHQQQQLVSTMIKHGFISDPFLSPSRLTTLSPPPSFKPAPSPNQSPTLFQMMSLEQARDPKPGSEAHNKLHDRISSLLSRAPFNVTDRWGVGDVRLTVASRSDSGEGESLRVSMDVHRRVLAAGSRFFAEKLRRSGTHSVEILECDDVAVYVEAVVLMYSDELTAELFGMDVSKILTLLKISSAIMFDEGVRACLEYLEAIPWSEAEEKNVISHLNELNLDGYQMDGVLQRVISDPSTSSRADEIFFKLSSSVLRAKDEKPRKEMKSLLTRLLDEDHYSRLDISRNTLYQLCHRCLSSLVLSLSAATCADEEAVQQDRGVLMAEIAREADNMQWIVGILMDRKIGEEFVKLWADQKELAVLHSKIPVMYRHVISKITAQVCVFIGQGKVLVPKEVRFGLLSTWLDALYDDFGWMRTCGGKSVDRKVVEEGLGRMILTLPLTQQQLILMKWFDRFVNGGYDCPNIKGAFEVWWRRAFVKQYVVESQLQVALCDVEH
ncbi:hypothetical protein ABFX02_04G188300 [Erythranthe guttata]